MADKSLPPIGTHGEIVELPFTRGFVIIGTETYHARVETDQISSETMVVVVGHEEDGLVVRPINDSEEAEVLKQRRTQTLAWPASEEARTKVQQSERVLEAEKIAKGEIPVVVLDARAFRESLNELLESGEGELRGAYVYIDPLESSEMADGERPRGEDATGTEGPMYWGKIDLAQLTFCGWVVALITVSLIVVPLVYLTELTKELGIIGRPSLWIILVVGLFLGVLFFVVSAKLLKAIGLPVARNDR